MLFRPLVATAVAGLALAGAGCGALSGDTSAPSTLTTIHGTIISSASPATGASLATAIVWFQPSADGTLHDAADSVPVSGTFPLSFTISLTAPPPASAMIDLGAASGDPAGDGVHYAIGYVVAYDDRNGNGRLDLVDTSAQDYVDAIEGIADRLVLYLDKPIPSAFYSTSTGLSMAIDGSTPRPGYNLLHRQPNYCYADANAGPGGTCTPAALWETMDTAVTLPLGTASPLVPQVAQELMCTTGPDHASDALDLNCGSGPCPPTISAADLAGALPSSDDPHVLCRDLNSFTYQSSCTSAVAGVCQPVSTVCTQETLVTLTPAGSPPQPVPAAWPCAAQPAPSQAYLDWAAAQRQGGSQGSGGISSAHRSIDAAGAN